jgi:predicted HTH transcriptional regulator
MIMSNLCWGRLKGQLKPENASLNVSKGASANRNASLSELQQRIINFTQDNKHISYDEITVLSAKDKATVRRNIQKLKKMGRLERIGAKKPVIGVCYEREGEWTIGDRNGRNQ